MHSRAHMTECIDTLYTLGIVPVISLEHADDAVPLAKALINGGLPVAEVTFRTKAASEAIRKMTVETPEMLVGAGTVTSIETAREAQNAGAKFIVTPGFNPEVVAWCLEQGIPVFPGCTTASEVEAAMNLGLSVVKFFPAEQSGGLAKIKALAAPYPTMRFMPTGGVSLKNMAEYLAYPKIFACGGSFMVPGDAIAHKQWDVIENLSREAARAAQGFALGHVGLYAEDADNAKTVGATFAHITGLPVIPYEKSLFVGPGMEVMHAPADCKAHLGYAVLNVERSARRLEKMGYEFDETTARRNGDGERTFVYLKGMYHGFLVHLLTKK
ncbi:MAG: hypothetical protein DELT_01762 [Desulfovibrio sp.]